MTKLNSKLLVSACLLGQPVRYDGKSKPLKDITWLQDLKSQSQLIEVCPEVMGGLSVPRDPAEMVGDKVITVHGQDVSSAFHLGAKRVLELCQQHQITHVLLKANSPSCGNQFIYDGAFSGTLIEGMGVTAKLLTKNGINVFSELQLEELKTALATATD